MTKLGKTAKFVQYVIPFENWVAQCVASEVNDSNKDTYAFFQIDCALLLLRSIILFTMGIGLSKCDPYNRNTACKDWTIGQLDDMKNLLSVHYTISGLGISICVYWKVLCPLWKYKDLPQSKKSTSATPLSASAN